MDVGALEIKKRHHGVVWEDVWYTKRTSFEHIGNQAFLVPSLANWQMRIDLIRGSATMKLVKPVDLKLAEIGHNIGR